MGEQFFGHASDAHGLWFPEQATDTQALFYESIAQFAEEVMAPAEEALNKHDNALARQIFRQCADLGVFAAELDEADEGLGFGVIDATLMGEALGRGNSLSVGLMVHQGVGMLPIACFGNVAQRAVYLPAAASGDCIMGFALTEAHCGSDALALTTSATPDGANYLLNGAKQFITNGGYAGCFITFARIPDSGITAFLVDADTPGVRIGPEESKLGQHASSTTSVYFENVAVDATKVLGVPGQGHKIALNMLNLGRLKLAAACVGKMKVLLPQAVNYTNERTAFGQSIAEFGMIRDRLARMASLLFAAESMVYRVASVMERALTQTMGEGGEMSAAQRLQTLQDFALECALVKSFASESLGTFTDDMLQLYGGYGFSEEYPAAKAFRDARVTRLYEGTTEICRLNVMQRLLTQLVDTSSIEVESPVPRQKALLQTLLQAYAKDYEGDLKALLREQTLVGPLAELAERLYAAESVLLRAEGISDYPRDVADYFVARSTSANLAAVHQIVAGLSDGKHLQDLLGDPCFATTETVPLRDRIIAQLLERADDTR